jgi:hypothetical protein
MSRGSRAERLYSALTAKERAILVLQALKSDCLADPLVRETTPAEQVPAFNGYMEVVRQATVVTTLCVDGLKGTTGRLLIQRDWLRCLALWAMESKVLKQFMLCYTKSRHRRLVERARSELLSPCDPADRSRMRELGGKKMDALAMNALDRIVDSVARSLIEGVQQSWSELLALELALGEASAEFDGEEPILPDQRSAMDSVRAELRDIHDTRPPYVGPFELAETDDELAGLLRRILKRESTSRISFAWRL